MAKITMEELYKNYTEANVSMAIADHRGELDYDSYYLRICNDGDMDFCPGYDSGAFSYYTRDSELQDMDEEEVIDWMKSCLQSSYDEDYQRLYEFFFGEEDED